MTSRKKEKTARIIELMILNNLPLSVQELVMAKLHQLSDHDAEQMAAGLEELNTKRQNLGKTSEKWLSACKETADSISAALEVETNMIEKELEEELQHAAAAKEG